MPNLNKSEIIIILDRSGSMRSICADMEGGFATFIAEQRAAPGEAVVSVYQFDDKFDTCFEERPIAQVTGLGLVPRGVTALLDAVGKAIVLVGERLAKKPEAERPGAVVVLVITDGMENSSSEYSRAQIAEMVKHQTEAYRWQFVYLGADASTFDEAGAIGMAAASYDANAAGVKDLMTRSSRGVAEYRSQTSRGTVGAVLHVDDKS